MSSSDAEKKAKKEKKREEKLKEREQRKRELSDPAHVAKATQEKAFWGKTHVYIILGLMFIATVFIMVQMHNP